MKIGLLDVDGKHFPNLALMKLSAYYKSIGDSVSFAYIGHFDLLYRSKVFTFTKESPTPLLSADEDIRGGTGYKNYGSLPEHIEHMCPDYSLYQCEHAYGFLTRGCIRKCPWCVVPKKEGELRANADIEEFLADKKSAILLDNNVLASEFGLQQIEKIVRLKIKVDFNQGLDARLIASDIEIAKLLSKVKWLKPLRMACDTDSQMESIGKATAMLRDAGAVPRNYFIYVLVKDIPSALQRVTFLKELGLDAFAQPYRDFEANAPIDPELRHFARWVNCKQLRNVSWQDYYKGKK